MPSTRLMLSIAFVFSSLTGKEAFRQTRKHGVVAEKEGLVAQKWGPVFVWSNLSDVAKGGARSSAGVASFLEVNGSTRARTGDEFKKGDKVGWIYSDSDVPYGSVGSITSTRRWWQSSPDKFDVQFPRGNWRFNKDELYRAYQHKFGFQTGDGVYISNSGVPDYDEYIVRGFTSDRITACTYDSDRTVCWNILHNEMCKTREPAFGWRIGDKVGWTKRNSDVPKGTRGEVTSFTCTKVIVKFPRDTWRFNPRELYSDVTKPTDPMFASGAWMPLHSIVGTQTYSEKVGTHKTKRATMELSWAAEVHTTVSASVKAGVEFLGTGGAVKGGWSFGASLRSEMAAKYASEWGSNSEEQFTVTFGDGGYLWQWVIRIGLRNGEVLPVKTKDFALTDGMWMKPLCLPGYALDLPRYQRCYNTDSVI